MCIVKAPKVATPKDPYVPVLRNPYLDGVDPLIKAKQVGVGSLRIDRTGGPSASIREPSLQIARSTRAPANL